MHTCIQIVESAMSSKLKLSDYTTTKKKNVTNDIQAIPNKFCFFSSLLSMLNSTCYLAASVLRECMANGRLLYSQWLTSTKTIH